jgi:hypothetical protein
LICFSSISRVVVLLRPHSANGPLLGTIAPSVMVFYACAVCKPAISVTAAIALPKSCVRMWIVLSPHE